jgi:hypothetical protein
MSITAKFSLADTPARVSSVWLVPDHATHGKECEVGTAPASQRVIGEAGAARVWTCSVAHAGIGVTVTGTVVRTRAPRVRAHGRGPELIGLRQYPIQPKEHGSISCRGRTSCSAPQRPSCGCTAEQATRFSLGAEAVSIPDHHWRDRRSVGPFEVDYLRNAFFAQTGQPSPARRRARQSPAWPHLPRRNQTRRHLTEFWMVAEVAHDLPTHTQGTSPPSWNALERCRDEPATPE